MPRSNEALDKARELALSNHIRNNIGTYKERSRHLILKLYYEPDTSNHEVKLGNYTADIFFNGNVIEIQTSSFGRLVSKLNFYLNEGYTVKVVYPINYISRVCWCDVETGDIKEGNYRTFKKEKYKVLPELRYIRDFIDNELFSIDIVYCKTSNYRLLNGYGEDKKGKSTKKDSVIEDIIDIQTINSINDLKDILKLDSSELYTIKSFKSLFNLSRIKLWSSVKFLTEAGIIEECTEKNGREKVFKCI